MTWFWVHLTPNLVLPLGHKASGAPVMSLPLNPPHPCLSRKGLALCALIECPSVWGCPVSVLADWPQGRSSLISDYTFVPPSSYKGGTGQRQSQRVGSGEWQLREWLKENIFLRSSPRWCEQNLLSAPGLNEVAFKVTDITSTCKWWGQRESQDVFNSRKKVQKVSISWAYFPNHPIKK